MATQTTEQFLEQYLFKQLNEIAPGKYVTAGVLQRLKSTLRNPHCTHLKGGLQVKAPSWGKDYNLSVFTFADGITEIKCLYGCGLKLRSNTADPNDFKELLNITEDSTNTAASSESLRLVRGGIVLPVDPGPVPTYTDADRARIQEREKGFWEWAKANPEEYKKQYGNISPNHPDPIEAPESIIERKMAKSLAQAKSRPPVLKGVTVTCQDAKSIPVADGVDQLIDYTREQVVASNTTIRKARKTQSRRKTNKK